MKSTDPQNNTERLWRTAKEQIRRHQAKNLSFLKESYLNYFRCGRKSGQKGENQQITY